MGKKKELDINTEAKIKNAARMVFHKKGFAATRTRDIAEAANINLALLNYYFRSKEKLFNIIMLETIQEFMGSFYNAFNEEETTLDEKIGIISSNYIDLLLAQPDIPLFILSEIRNNPTELMERFQAKYLFFGSVFAEQFNQKVAEGKIIISIYQLMMNLMGLMVFPFVASPLIKVVIDKDDEEFKKLILERKKMIPIWIKSMMYNNEEI